MELSWQFRMHPRKCGIILAICYNTKKYEITLEDSLG